MRIVTKPKVYLVGRQVADQSTIEGFLRDHETTWTTDSEIGAEVLCEAAGRVCYMSFGKGRKTNQEYLGHILESAHGSVLGSGGRCGCVGSSPNLDTPRVRLRGGR